MSSHFIKIDPYYLELGYKRQHAMLLTYLSNWQSWWQKEHPLKSFDGIYLSVEKIAHDLSYSTRSIYRWIDELGDEAIDISTEVVRITGGYSKRMKLALNPRLAKVRQLGKDVCQVVKDVCQVVNPSIYKTNLKNQSLKLTDPDAHAQINFDRVSSDSDADLKPLASTEPIPLPLDAARISGQKELFDGEYISGHQTSVEKFDRQMRISMGGGELAEQMLLLYNNGRPEHWGECQQLNSVLRGQIKQLRSRYGSDDELIEDWKAAILGYKASDFHNSPKFQSGGIYFLLAPNQPDRVKIAAEKWRSSSQSAKAKLAEKIVQQSNGRIKWTTGEVLDEYAASRYADILRKLIELPNHPDCPPKEWIETHYPEVYRNGNVD